MHASLSIDPNHMRLILVGVQRLISEADKVIHDKPPHMTGKAMDQMREHAKDLRHLEGEVRLAIIKVGG
jgi:hypothetical protein